MPEFPDREAVERARLTVALFRPDDDRLVDGVELIRSLGATPIPDPMLAVEPTGATPQSAEYVVFTSKTGVELAAEAGWEPNDAVVCAIGSRTARALREAGYAVDLVPEEFTSAGLVAALEDEVGGASVEVARSDHGSDVLLSGLRTAGAAVHETVLYRLVRPADSGRSAELAAAGDLDVALFTSSLTVEHFLDAAEERGVREEAIAGLNGGVVAAIGAPTSETAASLGLDVDLVPETASFEALATEAIEFAAPSHEGE
jgi:uroporphyrinogen-III synthase